MTVFNNTAVPPNYEQSIRKDKAMDSENHPMIDINLADEETLSQLRGVGSRLAKRIIAARPFESIEDLQRVRGISEKDIERLRPFLIVAQETSAPEEAESEVSSEVPGKIEAEVTESSPEETIPEAESVELDEEEDGTVEEEPVEAVLMALPVIEPEDESEPVSEEEIEPEEVAFESIPESETEVTEEEPIAEDLEPISEIEAQQTETAPGYITRGRAIALVFFSCFLTVILAVAVTLAIVSSLNRGQLTFASPSQVITLQTQVNGLAIQGETLASDLEGLRTRVDNLEALSGRVSDLESEITTIYTEMDTLQRDIDATKAQYQELESQLETINAQIESLQTQTSRFEGFLEGLRDLMTGMFPDTQE
jgi:prefoldin subunit 5/ribosomal protein S13